VAHRALQRRGEGGGVLADLAVHDHALLHRVHELDRVLDRDDVPAEVGVDVVDHRRERRRLAAAGGPRDDDEALVQVAELLDRLGQLQLLEGEDLHGDLAEHGGLAPVVVEEVAAESREAGDLVGEVEVLVSRKSFQRLSGTISFGACAPWPPRRAACPRSARWTRRSGPSAAGRSPGAGRSRPCPPSCEAVCRSRPWPAQVIVRGARGWRWSRGPSPSTSGPPARGRR
jgi:hypothetical protein